MDTTRKANYIIRAFINGSFYPANCCRHENNIVAKLCVYLFLGFWFHIKKENPFFSVIPVRDLFASNTGGFNLLPQQGLSIVAISYPYSFPIDQKQNLLRSFFNLKMVNKIKDKTYG